MVFNPSTLERFFLGLTASRAKHTLSMGLTLKFPASSLHTNLGSILQILEQVVEGHHLHGRDAST